MTEEILNVADRLTKMAQKIPNNIAIAEPLFRHQFLCWGWAPLRDSNDKRRYKTITFRQLDRDSSQIAYVMAHSGFKSGMKLALMVRQGIDFITLVFALYKLGATMILIDPGMGIKKMLNCLQEADPDGFVAIPTVQTARRFLRTKFPNAQFNLSVGGTSLHCGLSLAGLRKQIEKINRQNKKNIRQAGKDNSENDKIDFENNVRKKGSEDFDDYCAATAPDDPAAIIFTSGSTGTAKGVLYTHKIIDAQVGQIAERYGIEPGGVDLAGFPFFGLFNAAMGTTAVIPDMDPTHPAKIDPKLFLEAAEDWKITQSFGSPALWNRVLDYCIARNYRFKTLKRAISAGAPISFALLEKFKKCLPDDGESHTPYGATESLPVASITASEVLNETAETTKKGGGICVGKRFSKIEWRVIPISDGPVENIDNVLSVPVGQIGELAVCGPQVTQRYVTRIEANALAKMLDNTGRIWHRIGDLGRLDEQDRFWFCGRKAHRVETENGPLFSIPCEYIAAGHPKIFRAALAGVPAKNEKKRPVLFVEPFPEFYPKNDNEKSILENEVRELTKKSEITQTIDTIIVWPSFPVDVRHNAKINRELLSEEAEKILDK